jgi:hypothetical protein
VSRIRPFGCHAGIDVIQPLAEIVDLGDRQWLLINEVWKAVCDGKAPGVRVVAANGTIRPARWPVDEQ